MEMKPIDMYQTMLAELGQRSLDGHGPWTSLPMVASPRLRCGGIPR